MHNTLFLFLFLLIALPFIFYHFYFLQEYFHKKSKTGKKTGAKIKKT